MSAARRRRREPGTWVLGLEVAVAAASLVVLAFGAWRVGAGMLGAALLIGSFARTLLDEQRAGLLRVRRPISDVVTMSLLGVVIVVLAIVVPERPPGL
ncbi:MAG: DUF3017 domain-containing protein [Nocardioidaceae bacterium]|nr:DUF3017 domain-containing protein [Nocardioidaceae bacterium]